MSAVVPSKSPRSADDVVEVRGTLPPQMCGQLVVIGEDGTVQRVVVRSGHAGPGDVRVIRPVRTGLTIRRIVAFGTSILAFDGHGLTFELSPDLWTVRLVDVAGHNRRVGPGAVIDHVNGDLHLVILAAGEAPEHVVVSAGGLTRRTRAINDVPAAIQQIALTDDRILFVTDGWIGVAPRDGELRTQWTPTDVSSATAVHAFDVRGGVEVYALTPILQRWTLDSGGAIRREVIHGKPSRAACTSGHRSGTRADVVWTAADAAVRSHDLVTGNGAIHHVGSGSVGAVLFVPDPERPLEPGGGWLIVVVHGTSHTSPVTTELRILDAGDIAGPPIARLRIPRDIRRDASWLWVPALRSTA